MTGWTRKTLFRLLTAMLYLYRTGDARTYWVILPKRLKMVRDSYDVLRRQIEQNSARMMVEWVAYTFENHRSLAALIDAGRIAPVSEKDFRIPFRIKPCS